MVPLLTHCTPITDSFLELGLRTPTPTSSETQGQIVGVRESLNGWKNIYGTKKSKTFPRPHYLPLGLRGCDTCRYHLYDTSV